MVLLRKGNKPLGHVSSYRPICRYDGEASGGVDSTTALGPLGRGERSLGKQFGFRKGRSTVDAIQAAVNIATNARKGTGKRKGFCALISIDIRNAFNTARWNICMEAMMRKKVPDYLLRIIEDYLSDRWVIYQGDKKVSQRRDDMWSPARVASSASRMTHLSCEPLMTSES